jgi:hypothetical protein
MATQKNYTTDTAQVSGLWSGFKNKAYVLLRLGHRRATHCIELRREVRLFAHFNHLLVNDNTWAAK